MKHIETMTKRLMGFHLQYSFKNWSDAFECPVCGKKKRYSLNFLGRKKVFCNGEKFTRKEVARESTKQT